MITLASQKYTDIWSSCGTKEVKNEQVFLISTKLNVRIFGIRCLRQCDTRTDRYKTGNGETLSSMSLVKIEGELILPSPRSSLARLEPKGVTLL